MEKKPSKSVKDYAPREVIMTRRGPVIVCHFCERVVREIRK